MQHSLNYSGKGFCPMKIKMSQFPCGFCLNTFNDMNLNALLGKIDAYFYIP